MSSAAKRPRALTYTEELAPCGQCCVPGGKRCYSINAETGEIRTRKGPHAVRVKAARRVAAAATGAQCS